MDMTQDLTAVQTPTQRLLKIFAARHFQLLPNLGFV